MSALNVFLAVAILHASPAERDVEFYPSQLAYAANCDGRIVCAQSAEHEISWLTIDGSGKSAVSLKNWAPDLVHYLEHYSTGSHPLSGKTVLGKSDKYKLISGSQLHKYRFGEGYLWATSVREYELSLASPGYTLARLPFTKDARFKTRLVNDNEIPFSETMSELILPSDFKAASDAATYENLEITLRRIYWLHHETGDDVIRGDTSKQRFFKDVDFVLKGTSRFVMVVTIGGKTYVYEYTFARARAKLPHFEGRWERLGSFISTFHKPYHLACANGLYFFILDSGEIFTVEPKGNVWQPKPVWNDPQRPIIAMIAAEDGGGYVFGKEFYFKLGKKLEAKPCRDVTKSDPKTDMTETEKVLPRTRLIFECGRVLYENGELKPPEKPK